LHQKYTRLWRALLALLVRRGFLRADETRFVVLPKAAGSRTPGIIAALHEHQSSLLLRFPSLAPHLALLETCTAALPDVLQGTTSPVEVLFPRGSMERVEGIYKGNTLTDYWNRVCADTIVRAVEQRLRSGSGRTVTVLEVGAGTGATSRIVLDALKPFGTQVRFIYTDVSPRFVAHGRQFFGDLFPQAEFTVLDMEAPHSRSVEPSSVDILFATNALHASRDLRATLAGLSTLLRTGANIVINESTEPQDFATLTFGLTPGWWLFTDDSLRQPHSPLLSEAGWKSALATSCFGSVVGRGQSRAKTISPRQMIMEGVLLTTGRDKPAAVQLTPEPSSLPEINPQHIEHDAVCLYVRQIFSDLLKSPINRFAGHATFESFGIDSLVSQEIIARFEQDLGPVPAVLLFEYRTINELASHLTTAYREPLLRLNVLRPSEVSQAPTVQSISPNPTSPPDSSGRLRQEVYALADHEVDALLERLLSRAG
jgi:ubiquinone/menaquinone biosynthesis C-methylase UbiE